MDAKKKRKKMHYKHSEHDKEIAFLISLLLRSLLKLNIFFPFPALLI